MLYNAIRVRENLLYIHHICSMDVGLCPLCNYYIEMVAHLLVGYSSVNNILIALCP